jgi:PAS domain S-box-containing protein
MLKNRFKNTDKEPKSKRLITLIVVVSIIIFFSISGVLLFTTYLITFDTLERESNQYLEKTMDIAEHVITDKLENIQYGLNTMTSSNILIDAIQKNRSKIVEKTLYNILESDNGYYLDLLIVTKSDMNLWVKASLSYSLPYKFTKIRDKYGKFNSHWKIVNLGPEDSPDILLLKQTPIVSGTTGKVSGYLWAGISINTNFALIEDIKKHTEVDDVAFIFKGNYLISANLKKRNKLNRLKKREKANIFSNMLTGEHTYLRNTNSFANKGNFDIYISILSDHFKELRKTYTLIFFSLTIVLIVVGILVVIFIRNIIEPSLNNLIHYTELAPYENLENISYEPGKISEFNKVGIAVEKMALKIKEKQDSLVTAQSIAKIGSWDWNIDNKLFTCSEELFRIFGLEIQKSISNKVLFDMIHPDDEEMTKKNLNDAIKNEKEIEFDHRIVRHDGKVHWVHEKAKVIRNQEGTGTRLMGTIQDITKSKVIQEELNLYRENLELKVLERTKEMTDINELLKAEIKERELIENDLRKAKNLADSANVTKSRFIANMSHEIRTPMNSVIGYIDLSIENENIDPEIRNNLEIASNSASALLRLLNDILDVSRMEEGQLDLKPTKFSLKKMLKNVFEHFDKSVKLKGLDLTLADHPILSKCFLGDNLRISQVLINLIGNAVKFTKKGSVKVSVEPLNQDKLLFIIEDTGIGISQDDIEAVPTAFSQADTSPSRPFGGTGIGTTISKQLIEMMGGELWIESKLGEGSKFSFSVLIEEPECSDNCFEECEHYSREEKKISSSKSLKILHAEDLEANAKLAKIRLEKDGHKLQHVWNGKEALEAFKKDNFDLILMDVQMPEMDGLEATRQIRKYEAEKGLKQRIPIIAITASTMRKEIENCLKTGMDSVVAKPVDFVKLKDEIRKLAFNQDVEDWVEIQPACDEDSIKQVSKGVNLEKGLDLWGELPFYKEALIDFIKKYGNIAEDIKESALSDDFSKGSMIVHSLIGLSGNLALDELYSISIEIHKALKLEQKERVISLTTSFSEALSVVVEDINRIEIDEKVEKPSIIIDNKQLTMLFDILVDAIEQDELVVAEIAISSLSECLKKSDLEKIINALKEFDFEKAKSETLKLGKSLNLSLGGINEA